MGILLHNKLKANKQGYHSSLALAQMKFLKFGVFDRLSAEENNARSFKIFKASFVIGH